MAEIIAAPSALSKTIPVAFKINDTDSVTTTRLATKKQFNTTDTDAWLSFTLDGIETTNGEFDLTLINVDENPSSIFHHTSIAFPSIPFHYKLDAGEDLTKNEIRHAGRWIGQVIIRLANGDTTTRQFDFAIAGHLLDGKEARVILIEDYNALIATITASKTELEGYNIDYAALIADVDAKEALREQAEINRAATFDALVESEMVAQNVATKLTEKEATFAPRMLSLEEQLAHIVDHMEIEPDDLRTSDLETDGDLLIKAFAMAEGLNRNTVSIKLGRKYLVDKPIQLTTSISYKNQSHLIIHGVGGGLELAHNGFMFDGVISSGGLKFVNVKFTCATAYQNALFNADKLIQVVFEGCQFINMNTVVFANTTNGYLQSYRFTGCNFKGMRNHQIISAMVYDVVIANNIVEWGVGGLLKLTQANTGQYCSIGLFIYGNVIEGISEQSPIITTHNGNAVFHDNYFEGNNFPDIDMSGALIPHRSLKIKDNSFGDFSSANGKTACVKIGKLYSFTGYDFSGNTGTKTIFDFTSSGGSLLNLTGGAYLYNGNPSYVGALTTDIFIGSINKPKARKAIPGDVKTFEHPITAVSMTNLLSKIYLVQLRYLRTGSTLYTGMYSGYLYFVTGYNTTTSSLETEVRYKPIVTQVEQGFVEESPLTSLNVFFKSTGTKRIPLTSKDAVITDVITFTSTNSGVTAVESATIIDFGDIVMN